MRLLKILCASIIIVAAGCGDPYREGLDRLAHGQFEKAAQFFLQQTKKHPDDPRAFNELGYSYVRLKMYDQAGEAYTTAIKLKPDYLEARLNLGTMHLYKLDLDNAYFELDKALKINPNCEACRVNLAWVYINARRFDEAKEQIDKAAKIAGSKTKYANVLAVIQQGKERQQQAHKSNEETEQDKTQPSSPAPGKEMSPPPAEAPGLKPGGTE